MHQASPLSALRAGPRASRPRVMRSGCEVMRRARHCGGLEKYWSSSTSARDGRVRNEPMRRWMPGTRLVRYSPCNTATPNPQV
eukprot:scaffold29990_cov69-Phaeocystis_antarctica.AAC.1